MAKKILRNRPPLLDELDQVRKYAQGYEANVQSMRVSLYETLSELMRFKTSANSSKMNIETFNAFCIEQQIKGVKKASVQYPAVIRAVWSEYGAAKIDSALRYGRVLQKAEAENVHPDDLPDWLERAGGIEVVLQPNFSADPDKKSTKEAEAYKTVLMNDIPSLHTLPVGAAVPDGMGMILYRKEPGKDAELVTTTDNSVISEESFNGLLTKIGKSLRDQRSPVAALEAIRAYQALGDIALIQNKSDRAHIEILKLADTQNELPTSLCEIDGPTIPSFPDGIYCLSLRHNEAYSTEQTIGEFTRTLANKKIVYFELDGLELTIRLIDGEEITFDYKNISATRISSKKLYRPQKRNLIGSVTVSLSVEAHAEALKAVKAISVDQVYVDMKKTRWNLSESQASSAKLPTLDATSSFTKTLTVSKQCIVMILENMSPSSEQNNLLSANIDVYSNGLHIISHGIYTTSVFVLLPEAQTSKNQSPNVYCVQEIGDVAQELKA